jgi:D-glycero-alpha-D-manno-heptose 1-phosphate guanylyltransferase
MEPQQHKGPEMNELKNIECILLAGGLGTRLRSAVPDLPKCMAPIGNHPFLKYLIDYLISKGVTQFIFALGYMHEAIEAFLKNDYPALNYKISIENEPLGTGGAIHHALKLTSEKDVLILNGDTMYSIDIKELMTFHLQQHASCTLALKPMHNFDRYGVVEINKDNCIQSFKEKKFYENGLINGGVYVLNATDFLATEFPAKFSFEKEFLETYFASKKMCGLIQDEYFIDIGIPEDFEKASRELN